VPATLTTFLFEAANFVVLAAVLGWLFFEPVRRALTDRRAAFEADAQRAAETLAHAETVRQEIDTAHANLYAELNELRTRELEAARQQAGQLLTNARTAAERERETRRREAARISDAQRNALAQVAAAAAAETVGRLLEQIGGPDLQSALIRSACQQLQALPQDTFAHVKIESAAPLSAEQREALKDALGPAAAGADFRTLAELGAGVRIATAKGLIDASVSGLARFAGQSLAEEMERRTNNRGVSQNADDV